MNLEEFNASINEHQAPPTGLSIPLNALWWDAKGDGARAHALVDELGKRGWHGRSRLPAPQRGVCL